MNNINFLSSDSDLQQILLNFKLLDIIPVGVSIATDATCEKIIHNPAAAKFLRIEPWGQFLCSGPMPLPVKIYRNGRILSAEQMPIQQAAWYGKESTGCELAFVWEDGISKIARWSACPLHDGNGNLCGSIATLEDISDIVCLARELDKHKTNLTKKTSERGSIEETLNAAACLPENQAGELQALTSALPDGLIIYNKDGDPVYINEIAKKIFASYASCQVGKSEPLAERVKKSQAYTLEGKLLLLGDTPLYRSLKKGETVKDFGVMCRRGSNLPIYTSLSCAPIRGKAGEIIGAVALHKDITERKQVAEALSENEKRYQELVKHAPTGIYEVDFRNKRFLSVNDVMCQLAGYSREEFLEMSPFDILDEQSKITFQARIRQWLKGEKPDHNVEYKVRVKDGREIYALLDVTFTTDENGEPLGGTVIAHDITERKKAEEALRESEARLRSVLESSRDVIYRLNVQTGYYEYISPSSEEVVGYSADELMTLNMEKSLAMLHPDDLPAMHAMVARLEEKGEAELEYRQKSKEGEYRWISNRMSLTRDGAGRPLFRNGNIRDINASKQAEEALRESEDKYHAYFNNNIDAILLSSPDGGIEAANAEACRLFGLSEKEMIQIDRNGLVDLADPSLLLAWQTKEKSGQFKGELNFKRKDGSIFPGEVSSNTFTDRHGQIKTAMIIRDMTERKQMDAQLAFQAKLLSSVHDAIAAMDENYIITYWNMMSEEVFGWTAQEAIGRVSKEIFLGIAPNASWDEDLAKMFQDDFYEGEVAYYHKDGTPIHTDVHATVLRDKQGEFKGIVASFRDISRRRQEEEELKAIKDDLTSEVEALLKLHTLSTHIIAQKNKKQIYKKILDTAIDLSHADKGNIQLFDENGENRTLIAQKGFQEPFLHYFAGTTSARGSCGLSFKKRKRIIIEDVAQSPVFAGKTDLKYMADEHVHCCQSTPMLSNAGNFVGVLSTYYETAHTLNEREQRMLDLLARQAADIIEMTRAQEALQQSEQQALMLVDELKTLKDNLTAEVQALKIMHKLNSNFIIQDNLENMYGEILEATVSLTSAEKGCIQLYDEDLIKLKIILGHGLKDPFLQYFSCIDLETGPCGRACREKRRIIVEDVCQSPIFMGKPGLKYLIEEGIQSEQSTPLISSSGKFVGALNTYYADKKHFEEREFRMLDMLARLAADVIERIQIKERLKSQNKLLESINRIYCKALTCQTEEDIGSICLAEIEDIVGSTFGFIGIINAEGHLDDLAISLPGSGFNKKRIDHHQLPKGFLIKGLFGRVIRDGQSLLNNDSASHPDSVGLPPGHPLIRSFLGVPLLEQGRTVGIVAMANREGGFSQNDMKSLEALSETIVQVLMRRRAEHALRRSEEQALTLLEELRKADHNKNQFLSSLSHELRNPLASMMMSLSLLKLAAPGSEQDQQAKEILERQTVQLSRLVDDLLEVTRISQNKIILKKEFVELNFLASKTVEDHKPLFTQKEMGLEVELSSGPIHLQADPIRLKQIIGNLLHNALKFTEKGGKAQVIITKDKKNGQALIEVKDNGLGIKPEVLPNLFQPFMQAEISLDRSSGGLGLGLAIVKGMVELHGGSVTANSEGLGKGSRFAIRLPLPAAKVLEQEKEKQQQEGRKNLRSRRIMVIDDIPDVAQILCSLLLHLGNEVVSAPNGIKGLAKAREFCPDVIFCDIGLPGMNGYEVAKCIRADNTLKKAFMIALSGYAQPDDMELAMEAGFNKHLAKPVDLNTLSKVLTEVP